MRPLPRRLILAAALLGVAATDPEGNYDQPLDRRVVDLGPSATAPEQHAELRCHYFRSFMVKEIDARELGAKGVPALPAGECARRDRDFTGGLARLLRRRGGPLRDFPLL